MANISDLNNKFVAKRKNMHIPRGYADVTPDELKLLVQIVNSNTGCGLFAVLAIGAAVLAVFGSGNVKLHREPLCCCLEYIGDNGPCPVHGDPFGEKEGKS